MKDTLDARHSRPSAEDAPHKGIKEVAKQLDVTARALRFYEDNNLISPKRVGSTRIYSRRDIGRIQLILRGKRLGFTIREIKEFLDLYDSDPDHREQLEHLLQRVQVKLEALRNQKMALEETIRELREIAGEVVERLEGSSDEATRTASKE